jgi:hypothetical protein
MHNNKEGHSMRQSIAALAFVLLVWPAVADEPKLFHVVAPEAAPEASADCNAGIVYDDGVFGDFYGLAPAYIVMKFDLPSGATRLDQVCACFSRSSVGSSTLPFEVVVFDDNGLGGSPGTFLGSVAATAESVPVVGSYDFYNVSLASSGITLPDNSVYVGVYFNSNEHYVCGDRSDGTAQRPIYHSSNGLNWGDSATAFSGSGPKSWGIRVDPASTLATCMPTSDTLCLNGGRFRVSATFETTSFSSGNAQAVKMTDDTGYFWFFQNSNVEAVVKVLDGCGYNSHYWVFAGGLTDVRTVFTVTDTRNGQVRTYVNPQQTAFQPIQDTGAFGTCP